MMRCRVLTLLLGCLHMISWHILAIMEGRSHATFLSSHIRGHPPKLSLDCVWEGWALFFLVSSDCSQNKVKLSNHWEQETRINFV